MVIDTTAVANRELLQSLRRLRWRSGQLDQQSRRVQRWLASIRLDDALEYAERLNIAAAQLWEAATRFRDRVRQAKRCREAAAPSPGP